MEKYKSPYLHRNELLAKVLLHTAHASQSECVIKPCNKINFPCVALPQGTESVFCSPCLSGFARCMTREAAVYISWDSELPSHSAPPCGEEWQAGGASSFLFSTTKRRNMSLQKTEESEYYFGSTSWQCWDTLLGEVNCMHPLQLACFLYGIIKGRVTNKVKNSGACGKVFTLC